MSRLLGSWAEGYKDAREGNERVYQNDVQNRFQADRARMNQEHLDQQKAAQEWEQQFRQSEEDRAQKNMDRSYQMQKEAHDRSMRDSDLGYETGYYGDAHQDALENKSIISGRQDAFERQKQVDAAKENQKAYYSALASMSSLSEQYDAQYRQSTANMAALFDAVDSSKDPRDPKLINAANQMFGNMGFSVTGIYKDRNSGRIYFEDGKNGQVHEINPKVVDDVQKFKESMNPPQERKPQSLGYVPRSERYSAQNVYGGRRTSRASDNSLDWASKQYILSQGKQYDSRIASLRKEYDDLGMTDENEKKKIEELITQTENEKNQFWKSVIGSGSGSAYISAGLSGSSSESEEDNKKKVEDVPRTKSYGVDSVNTKTGTSSVSQGSSGGVARKYEKWNPKEVGELDPSGVYVWNGKRAILANSDEGKKIKEGYSVSGDSKKKKILNDNEASISPSSIGAYAMGLGKYKILYKKEGLTNRFRWNDGDTIKLKSNGVVYVYNEKTSAFDPVHE